MVLVLFKDPDANPFGPENRDNLVSYALCILMAEHVLGSFCIILPLRAFYNLAVNAALRQHLQVMGLRLNHPTCRIVAIPVSYWRDPPESCDEYCSCHGEGVAENERPPPDYEQVLEMDNSPPPAYDDVKYEPKRSAGQNQTNTSTSATSSTHA